MTTSQFVVVCDALADLIQSNATGLDYDTVPAARLHRYEPQDPELLKADGYRHLAVYPVAELQDQLSLEESTMDSQMLRQRYAVVVWQGSLEGSRLVRDEEGMKVLLDIHEEIMDVLYHQLHQTIGGSALSWNGGTDFATRVAMAQWFRIFVELHHIRNFA